MCSAATLVLRAQVLQTLSDFPGSFSNFRLTSIADTDSISNAFTSSRIKEERGFQSNILVLPRWQNITYKCGSDHSILWRNFYPRLALLVFRSKTSRICSNFAKQSENNWSPFLVFLCGFDHFPAPREFDSCLRPSFSLPFEHLHISAFYKLCVSFA